MNIIASHTFTGPMHISHAPNGCTRQMEHLSHKVEVVEVTYGGKPQLEARGSYRISGGPRFGSWSDGNAAAVSKWLTLIRSERDDQMSE